MLERNLILEPCCLISSKLQTDPEDLYIKHFSSEEPGVHDVLPPPEKRRTEEKADPEKAEPGLVLEEEEMKKKVKTGWKRYIGLFLVLMATMTYSLATLIIKVLHEHHPFTVSFWRFQGILIPAIPLLLYFRLVEKKGVLDPIWPLNRPQKLKMVFIILLRSIIGCTSTICHIWALQYISMPDASIIAFSCPCFVILIAHLLGMEKMGYTSVVVALLTLVGVGIISRPPIISGTSDFDSNMLIGCGLAFASMILASLVIIILRNLRAVHFSFMMTSYGLIGTLECAVVAYFTGVFQLPSDPTTWALCFGLTAFTFCSQICLISSLKYEEAGPVALVQSMDNIFAFIWQFIAFSAVPDIYSVSGSVIVISCVGVITFKKVIGNLPENHRTRRTFRFLLK